MAKKVLSIVVVILVVVGAGVWYGASRQAKAPTEDLSGTVQETEMVKDSGQVVDPLDAQSGKTEEAKPADKAPAPVATNPPPAQEVPKDATKAYTLAEVAVHKDAKSCWTVVRGEVYDLTAWIALHPGGAANIVKLCGRDGTADFARVHEGKAQQEAALAKYKIGMLKN